MSWSEVGVVREYIIVASFQEKVAVVSVEQNMGLVRHEGGTRWVV